SSHDWGDIIVVVCEVGESSIQAGRLLEAYEGTGDAEIYSLKEGINGWSYQLVTEE
ncbi:rhodanese-like domain-containing protein, partial [archaeon SCG-AAA382B04]